MALAPLCRFLVTPSATHNQFGPLWYCFPGGWICIPYRWVSEANSPLRLEISPASASTPTGVFNQRFEALFPCAGALGCAVCFAPPPFLLIYLCVSVGPQGLPATTLWGLPAAAWPAPFHNPPLRWALAAALPGVLATPASGLHPSHWSGWMFLLYLLGCQTSIQFDFLSVLVVFCF